jgi:Resolvase, N terminal domain
MGSRRTSNVGAEFRNPGRRSVGLHIRVIVVRPPEPRQVHAEVEFEVARDAVTQTTEYVLTCWRHYVIVTCMKEAFAYLRVSGRGQIEGDGFVRQEEAVRRFAAANGLDVVSVFREEGVSGTKDLESRPALLELLETAKESGGTVIIEKLDRLARDLMVSESILADFRRKGITVISVAEPDLCSNEPTRILMRQMMSAFAQYESPCLSAIPL